MRRGLRVAAAVGALIVGCVGIGGAGAESPENLASSVSVAQASQWRANDAKDLLALVETADREGLRAIDYRPAALRRAIDGGEGAALDAAAGFAARTLAHDFLVGRVTDRAAFGWLVEADPYALSALPDRLDAAVREHRVASFLKGLLPDDPRYRALRHALAEADSPAERDALRANLERARWMPREMPDRYLYVNVPSYRLEVIDGGIAASSYPVVVGARETPTPMLISDTASLVVNPWWNVPQSIVKSSNLRPGVRGDYLFKAAAGGGWQVRQPPGPRNALGRIKFNLDNDQAIYLHDTPAKAGFRREARALSHGCIRVQDIDQLAAELMEADGGARLDAALAEDATATLRLPRTWSAYLVYFTRDVDSAGNVVRYGDPYARDPAMITALDGGAIQVAVN